MAANNLNASKEPPAVGGVLTTDNSLSWPQVILFGDSLTQYSFSPDGCWGSHIADYLQRKCDVVNRGFSGYNSRWNKLILPKLLNQFDVENIMLFTIFLGANDSVVKTVNPSQHVPLEEYKDNLLDMVNTLQSRGVDRNKIVLISPPACDEEAWAADCKVKGRVPSKCNDTTKKYAEACVEAAGEAGTLCVDFYSAMMKDMEWKSMLNDGLHLSTKGSECLFHLLKPILDKHTQSLPFILPYWADIDNDNPEAALDKHL